MIIVQLVFSSSQMSWVGRGPRGRGLSRTEIQTAVVQICSQSRSVAVEIWTEIRSLPLAILRCTRNSDFREFTPEWQRIESSPTTSHKINIYILRKSVVSPWWYQKVKLVGWSTCLSTNKSKAFFVLKVFGMKELLCDYFLSSGTREWALSTLHIKLVVLRPFYCLSKCW